MRVKKRVPWPTTLLTLLLLPACEEAPTPAESVVDSSQEAAALSENSVGRMPFDEAQVFFELNTTDHDMGFQVFLDAEGWRRVSLRDPNGNRLLGIFADGRLSEIGITELRFESAEPSPAEVRSRFPAGRYTFRGETVEGATLVSEVTLSQRLLPAPTFSPRNGQVVDRRNTVVRWDAPGAEQVEIIIENDALGHVLDVTVSGSTDRLTIPRQFLRPGREYKIEVLSIAENGNRTIAESTFVTAET
jgi:hypothetical protein